MTPASSPGGPRPRKTGRRLGRVLFYTFLGGLVVAAALVRWLYLTPAPPESEVALRKADALYRKLPKTVTHSCGLEAVLLPPGKMMMGHAVEDQQGRMPPPGQKPVPIFDPQTPSTFTDLIYLGIYEVTQEQYEQVMGVNPSLTRGKQLPVERVTWEDALRFCRKLGEQDGQTWRLPTAAEWEYACRAGTTTSFHVGASLSGDQANFDTDMPSKWSSGGPNRGKTLPVGSFPANAFGLHDMHGNVAEWCLDLFPSGGTYHHTTCGGSWQDAAEWCRSASRSGQTSTSSPSIGFRVVRTVTPDPKWRLGPAPEEGVPADGAKWVRARIDEAFAKPTKPFLPGVLVFPPVYAIEPEKNKWFKGLTETQIIGALPYSLAANMALAYGPQRRMDLSPQLTIDTFQTEHFDSQDGKLTDSLIARCLERVGCKLYVVSRLAHADNKKRLIVEMHGDVAHPDRMRSHDIPSNNWSFIPGLIALDVLEWLGVKPSAEEAARLRQPLCRGVSSPSELGELMNSGENSPESDKKFQDYLQKEPSLAAWYVYLIGAIDQPAALKRYEGVRSQFPCDLFKIRQASILRASGRLSEAFDLLLELAPTHRGDTFFHAQLLKFGMALGEEGLVEYLLRNWEKEGPDAPGAILRGRMLTAWAWEARGDDFAGAVTQEAFDLFHQRLKLARRQLESAIEKSGKIPDPHVKLITVAMGLGLPREYAAKHYHAAVAADPKFGSAYHTYFNYLMPRWHGHPEEMLDFARDCIQSGLWEEGVPNLFLTAVKDVAFDPKTGIYNREVFEHPVVWEGLEDYFAQTRKMKDRAPRNEPWALFNDRACSYFLLWGSFCGKRAELEGGLTSIVHPDLKVFPDTTTYFHIRDQIRSVSGKGPEQLVAKVRLALASGSFDEAERLLKPDDDWPAASAADRQRLQRCLAQGRRFVQDGAIKLSPRDILDGWTVRGEKGWRVEGSSLISSQPAGKSAFVQCPFPIGPATIKGELECRGGLHSAQIILHACSAIDPVRILFTPKPQGNSASLSRFNARLGAQRITPGSQRFLIEVGPTHDSVVLNGQKPGMRTPVPSFKPGRIAFESYTTPIQAGEFVLGPLEITSRAR